MPRLSLLSKSELPRESAPHVPPPAVFAIRSALQKRRALQKICVVTAGMVVVLFLLEAVSRLVVNFRDRPVHEPWMPEISSRIMMAADPLRRLFRKYVAYDPTVDERWTSFLIGPDSVIRFELVHEGPRGIGELLELIKQTETVTRYCAVSSASR
jgi:hypothetical protein